MNERKIIQHSRRQSTKNYTSIMDSDRRSIDLRWIWGYWGSLSDHFYLRQTSSAPIWPNDEQLCGMCLVHPAQEAKSRADRRSQIKSKSRANLNNSFVDTFCRLRGLWPRMHPPRAILSELYFVILIYLCEIETEIKF